MSATDGIHSSELTPVGPYFYGLKLLLPRSFLSNRTRANTCTSQVVEGISPVAPSWLCRYLLHPWSHSYPVLCSSCHKSCRMCWLRYGEVIDVTNHDTGEWSCWQMSWLNPICSLLRINANSISCVDNRKLITSPSHAENVGLYSSRIYLLGKASREANALPANPHLQQVDLVSIIMKYVEPIVDALSRFAKAR